MDRIATAISLLALAIAVWGTWNVHRMNVETYQNIEATLRLLHR